jgi:hypothetical protein
MHIQTARALNAGEVSTVMCFIEANLEKMVWEEIRAMAWQTKYPCGALS